MKRQYINAYRSSNEKNKTISEIRSSIKNDKSPAPKRASDKVKLTYAIGSRKNKGQFSFSLRLS